MAETPDKPEHEAHKAAAAPKAVTLALVGAASKYDTFIVGDTVIKTELEGATEVPSADVDAILAAADASGVTVQKVS